MPLPLVTVVTCTFGRPEALLRAVQSVERQTFRDFQHIVVEDAGNSPSIHTMGLPSSLLLMTMEKRTGWPGFICRNEGARRASGDLITFLDDDNWYEPEHLETLVEAQREMHADFVWGSTRLLTPSGEVIGYRRMPTAGIGTVDISEILCKRALFIGSGGLDPRDGAPGDGCMVDRWLQRGARSAHSDAVTLNYTVNEEESLLRLSNDCLLRRTGYSLE